MHIRTEDIVMVTAGDQKGTQGRVLRVLRKRGLIVVEGVNKAWKHVRRSQKNPQGGRLSKEQPIRLAAVQLVCSACNRPTRTGARATEGGGKERFCKKCGAGIGKLAPAKDKKE